VRLYRLETSGHVRPAVRQVASKPPVGDGDDEGDDNSSTDEAAEYGETIYTETCEQLHINRVQRVIDGLSTATLNLKYRCLGPLGARALAAALSVSISAGNKTNVF